MLILAFSGVVRGSTHDDLNTICLYSCLTVKYDIAVENPKKPNHLLINFIEQCDS